MTAATTCPCGKPLRSNNRSGKCYAHRVRPFDSPPCRHPGCTRTPRRDCVHGFCRVHREHGPHRTGRKKAWRSRQVLAELETARGYKKSLHEFITRRAA